MAADAGLAHGVRAVDRADQLRAGDLTAGNTLAAGALVLSPVLTHRVRRVTQSAVLALGRL